MRSCDGWVPSYDLHKDVNPAGVIIMSPRGTYPLPAPSYSLPGIVTRSKYMTVLPLHLLLYGIYSYWTEHMLYHPPCSTSMCLLGYCLKEKNRHQYRNVLIKQFTSLSCGQLYKYVWYVGLIDKLKIYLMIVFTVSFENLFRQSLIHTPIYRHSAIFKQ